MGRRRRKVCFAGAAAAVHQRTHELRKGGWGEEGALQEGLLLLLRLLHRCLRWLLLRPPVLPYLQPEGLLRGRRGAGRAGRHIARAADADPPPMTRMQGESVHVAVGAP